VKFVTCEIFGRCSEKHSMSGIGQRIILQHIEKNYNNVRLLPELQSRRLIVVTETGAGGMYASYHDRDDCSRLGLSPGIFL